MFWKYHFLLLFVPIAVLAARGIDLLLLCCCRRTAAKPLADTGCVDAFLALPAMGAIGLFGPAAGRTVPRAGAGPAHRGHRSYRHAVGRDYGWIREHLLSLRNPAGGEPIYVFGDPLIYLVTERRQAIPINGWSWEAYPSELWKLLPEMLAAARPAYLFVDNLNETDRRDTAFRRINSLTPTTSWLTFDKGISTPADRPPPTTCPIPAGIRTCDLPVAAR